MCLCVCVLKKTVKQATCADKYAQPGTHMLAIHMYVTTHIVRHAPSAKGPLVASKEALLDTPQMDYLSPVQLK